jgi:hypothetical protein
MAEGTIHKQTALVAHGQSTEVSQPGKSPLDLPASSIAPQFSSVLRRRLDAVVTMRADQFDASASQPGPQWVAVVTPIGNQSLRPTLGPTPATAWNFYLLESFFHQSHFGWRGLVQVDSQRNTLAVDHHHPLRALAALGFADGVAPFLAAAKLPSIKLSCQLSWPRWSNSARKARHIRSQTPCSSQRRRRFQHTLGLTPNSLGKSRHRAPVLRIQRMPANTWRSSLGGRPSRLRFRVGNNGLIFCHCASESNDSRMTIFSPRGQKSTSTNYSL